MLGMAGHIPGITGCVRMAVVVTRVDMQLCD